MQKSVEIFRFVAGTASRSNYLTLLQDGSIRMDTQDTGSTAEELFGEHAHEFSVTVPAQAMAELAFSLLHEHFRGKPNAVESLRDLCRRDGVTHRVASRDGAHPDTRSIA